MIGGAPGLLLVVEGLERRLGKGSGAFGLTVPSLRLRAGDRLAVVGPSGAGKSTLLGLLALALRPDACRAFLLRAGPGQPLQDAARLWMTRDEAGLAWLRARAIGFVPQTGGLLPFLTLRANIGLTQTLSGRPEGGLVEHLAERLGIRTVLDRKPAEVSVGQRQRAAVARALVHRPAVILADEPTASVHPAQADEILSLLHETAEAGTAVLVSTHDLARAESAGFAVLACEPEASGRPASTLQAHPHG